VPVVALDPAVRRNLSRTEAGAAWIARLPQVLANLRGAWEFGETGPPYPGGSHSLVAPVVLSGGSPAVLKVPVVDAENRLEAEALRLYGGDGAVELLAYDERSGAMLVEQATPGTPLEHHPDQFEAIAIGCELLSRLSRPAPPGHRFHLVTQQARTWSQQLTGRSDEVGDATARGLLAEAARTAAELSTLDVPPHLVNRDAHLGNVLAARREPWLLIDPKPLVGDPAFDAGYLIDWLLGDDPTPDRAERIVTAVAAALRVPEDRARAWATVRAMDNYHWAQFDETDDPDAYLRTAVALTSIA
jgi:streptomycin 6-kinase